MVKRIGREARTKIEAFIGQPVYLDLWVKVRRNWRKSDADLRQFGYLT
jgi:GTP-binding protein Era